VGEGEERESIGGKKSDNRIWRIGEANIVAGRGRAKERLDRALRTRKEHFDRTSIKRIELHRSHYTYRTMRTELYREKYRTIEEESLDFYMSPNTQDYYYKLGPNIYIGHTSKQQIQYRRDRGFNYETK
jgi:hypothetical protein